MNYKHILSIAFLLIAGILTSAVANEADWMPDANLRQKVRAKLDLDADAELDASTDDRIYQVVGNRQ